VVSDYLAIVTLAFGEIMRLVLINWVPVTNGYAGITGIPRPTFFGIPFNSGRDNAGARAPPSNGGMTGQLLA
jgi:branched-chain amino acid transport system permease protein